MICILCLGENSQNIVEQLGGEVGGIDLQACNDSTLLKNAIANAGKLEKVIINEKAIVGELPESLKSGSFNVIFILKTPELLQKYAIEYYGYSHIQIVNKSNSTSFTTIELKEYISKAKLDDYLLYKEDIQQEEEEPEEEEAPIPVEEPTGPIAVEEAPINLQSDLPLTEEEPIIKVTEEPTPVKQSLYTEPEIKVNIKNTKDKDDEIRHIVSNYKDADLIIMEGLPNSYCSTIAWNLANYMSRLGKTALLIDCDSTFYPLSYMNKTLFNMSINATDNLRIALTKEEWMQSAYLERSGLLVLSNNVISNEFDFNKSKDLFLEFIRKQRKVFDVIIVDMPYTQRYNLQEVIKESNTVVYTLRHTDKDYLKLLRLVQMTNPEVAKETGKKSCYIEIDPDNTKLLQTSHKDMQAIDEFLENMFNIVNENRYSNIKKVGEIFTDKKNKWDLLTKPYIIPNSELQSLWLNILDV